MITNKRKKDLLPIFIFSLSISILGTTSSNKFYEQKKQENHCNSCQLNLTEARATIIELENRTKTLSAELSKWMKMYSDEIAQKAAAAERNAINIMKYAEKYTNLAIKVSK